jgi:threonine 3-dehydrogenase
MMAAVKTRAAPDSYEVKDVSVPPVGRDEVLIRVKIASICGTDVHIADWDEWARRRIKPPLIQGHEFAGEVVEVAEGAAFVQVGDYVSAEGHVACGHCFQCRNGQAHVCQNVRIIGIDRDGAFAEYVVVPEKNVVKNDPRLPLEYATMQDPFGNAVFAVFNADVPGHTVAVFGLGPIGLMTVALCRAVGAAKVFAVGHRNRFRIDMARTLGADMVFGREDDAVAAIRDATNGVGVDHALEMSGAPKALLDAFEVVRDGGTVQILGIYSKPVEIDVSRAIVTKALSVHGIHGRRMFQDWHRMQGLLLSGNLDLMPILTHRFPLDRFEEAMDVMRSGDCGKVALVVKEGE